MSQTQTRIEPRSLAHEIEGEGPELVLIHPASLDGRSWDAFVERLTGGYRIMRVDLRGHGNSPPAEPGMEIADYAADVALTMREAGFSESAVCGLSVGGMVAMALALDHPWAVGRLVVAGSPATLPAAARPVLSARGEAALEGGMEAVVAESLERWFTPAFLAAGGGKSTRDRLLADDPAGWNSVWQAISRLDLIDRIEGIQVPTLCVAGDLDPASPPKVLKAIVGRITGAEYAELAGAPHMMHIETPGAFAKRVEDFLRIA